jgi:hypothetical protein
MTKNKYTIHLLGQDIDVKMNMKVIIAYEEITGTSFYGENFDTSRTRYALLAAIIAASNANSDISDRLLTDVSGKEFTAAFEVAMQAAADFFEIPTVIKQDEEPKQEGEQPKN